MHYNGCGIYSGSRLIGRLGSRHSVPINRFNYTIRYEFVSKTSSRLTEYPVYLPIKQLPLYSDNSQEFCTSCILLLITYIVWTQLVCELIKFEYVCGFEISTTNAYKNCLSFDICYKTN